MSIVIAVIDHTLKNLYLYADNRRTVIDNEGNKTIMDDFSKIFEVREGLLAGGTGNVRSIELFLPVINNNRHLSNDLLINLIKTEDLSRYGSDRFAFVMCGIDSNKKFFVISKNTDGEYEETRGNLGEVSITISSIGGNTYDVAYNELKRLLKENNFSDYNKAIEGAILSASKIDASISQSCDRMHLYLKN